MKRYLTSIICKLQSDKWKKIISLITFFSILVYFIVGISAYASWFPGSTKYFVYNSTSGFILRAATSIFLICSGILIILSNLNDVKWRWWILLSLWIIACFIMIFVSQKEFYVLYTQTQVYPFLTESKQIVSYMTDIKMFFSFAVDLIFGFMSLFIFYKALNKRWYYLILTILFLLIILYSCFYSYLKETDYYVYFFKGDWKYSAESIGSIFGNKQQWGIFLAAVFPIACLTIWIACKMNVNKFFKILIILFCIGAIFCSSLCGLVAFCKTTLVADIVFAGIFCIGLIVYLYKKKKIFYGSILVLFVLLAILLVVLTMTIPALQTLPIFSFIYKMVDTLFTRGQVGFDQRFFVVERVMQNFPGVNLFFGIPKGSVDVVFRGIIPEMQDHLHTGIIIFFARSGIFGIIIYFVLLFILFKKYFLLCFKKPMLAILLIGLFGVAVILDLSELEILLLSSSMNVFVINIMGVTFANSEIDNFKEDRIYETQSC